MRFLLDTNVLSEVRRSKPQLSVLQWLDEVDEDRVYVSVITLSEIRRGIDLMDAGQKRDTLARWLSHDLLERFSDRIVPIDIQTALIWGKLMASAKKAGFTRSTMDGFIAATALSRDLTLVTRNTKDFHDLGMTIVNPWNAAARR